MEERHPIPQNVTGFEFKLIGDMTIKQFAYLAANAIIAYIAYLLPVPFILRFPFVLFFALSGIALAFVPFQGRPLDRWIANFFKAVFSSSEYVYEGRTAGPQPPAVERAFGVAQTPPPSKPEEDSSDKLLTLEQQLQNLLIEKKRIEKELFALKKLQEPIQKEQEGPYPTSQVRSIPQEGAASFGIPSLPQFPNLIVGIVKDSKGNLLPNILVDVKDQDGTSVRAFKTNKLGQFQSATQLLNGTYTIELEDPRGQFKFDRITVVLDGKVVLPLEIQNLEPREELRRKLFGA